MLNCLHISENSKTELILLCGLTSKTATAEDYTLCALKYLRDYFPDSTIPEIYRNKSMRQSFAFCIKCRKLAMQHLTNSLESEITITYELPIICCPEY